MVFYTDLCQIIVAGLNGVNWHSEILGPVSSKASSMVTETKTFVALEVSLTGSNRRAADFATRKPTVT